MSDADIGTMHLGLQSQLEPAGTIFLYLDTSCGHDCRSWS